MTDQLVLVAHRDVLVLRRPGAVDRVLARLRGDSLDERLAAGVPAEHDVLLAVRAWQLTSWPARRRLAAHWSRLLDARRPVPGHRSSAVPVDHFAVAAAAPSIEALAARLRDRRPVAVRGVAMAMRLLSGPSPVYLADRRDGDLTAAVDAARAALADVDDQAVVRGDGRGHGGGGRAGL